LRITGLGYAEIVKPVILVKQQYYCILF